MIARVRNQSRFAPGESPQRHAPWSLNWHSLVPWIGALVFASLLAIIPNEGLKDRDNYLAFLENAPIFLLGWLQDDILSILANEPLWILLANALAALLASEQALSVIVVVPAWLVAYQVLKQDPRQAILLMAFLLSPQILKNHVIQLRQGLAIAIFLTAWFASTRSLRWVLLLLTPFIHSSFFFVLLLIGLTQVLRRLQFSPRAAVAVYVLLGVTVGVLLDVVVKASGARQGEEASFGAAEGISGLGFLYWAVGLVILLFQSRAFLREHMLEVGSVAFYLATYFLSPFTARVFESTLLLVFLAALRMRGTSRLAFVFFILLYSVLQWLLIINGASTAFTISDD